MKQGIHPEYVDATIICGCGNRIETRSTQPEIHVEICSVCHPFYTGKQRLVDTAGRVERFNRKYGKTGEEKAETPDLPEGPADDSVLQTEADDAEGADDASAEAGDESDAEAEKTAETAEA